jgi:hypothetical protein
MEITDFLTERPGAGLNAELDTPSRILYNLREETTR